jgi:hypothetical protein
VNDPRPVPHNLPGRTELWYRLQLARSILQQRPANDLTITLALCALDGVPAETLLKEAADARQQGASQRILRPLERPGL